jgi:hypothetical protein
MTPKPPEEPLLRVWHYQAWCGVCLTLIFMGQFSQGILLTNVLACLLGALGIVSRLRWGAFFVLIGVGFAQSMHFFTTERFTRSWGSAGRELDLHDFLLALGILGYVVGQYRLQGLWHHLWPPDPRERRGRPQATFLGLWPRPPMVRHRRREGNIRPQEMVSLSILTPLLVLAGMLAYTLTRPPRGWLNMPWGLGHFLILFWVVVLGAFVLRHIMEIWQTWTQSMPASCLFLHDQLWAQTRGEMRRIARWRAWRKIEDEAKKDA